MAEHRVSLLGASLRRYEDPANSRDPRIQSVVTALKQIDIAPPPRAHFRAELRAQLVAVAPRLVTEGTEGAMIDIVPRPAPSEAAAEEPPPPRRDRERGRWLRIPVARPLAIAAALVVAFMVLLGGAVWMSKKALPGDALYGLKRASENVELSLASSPQERAQDYLDFAATRVDEARALAGQPSAMAAGGGAQAGAISPHTASLITSTLASADSDVKNASQLLGTQAVQTDSAHPLTALTSWAPGQLERLQALAAVLPNSPVRSRTVASTHLVKAALHRAKTLATKVSCGSIATAGSDDLGPVPVNSCTAATVTPNQRPARPHHTHSGTAKTHGPGSAVLPTLPAVGPGSSGGGKNTGGKSNSSSSSQKPPVTLPTLPTLPNPLPSNVQPSVGLTKCGLAANLGKLVVINLDLCKLLGGTPHPTG